MDSQATSAPPRFKDLTFGWASADYEASHSPDLLLHGFIDPMNLVAQAKTGGKFLFLGYKGSGKSALGEHLRLLSQQNPHLFVRFVNIADVSFSTFSQILKGNIEPEARYPVVWSWLLLLFLLDLFSTDEGSNYTQDDALFLSIEALKQVGILPRPDLNALISATAARTFSIKLSTVLGSLEAVLGKSQHTGDLPFLVSHLKLLAHRFKSQSTHLLVIDGFDELLRRGHLQYDALGALVFEAARLNMDFATVRAPAKILVLCRTDLFERLPGPNKNKVRQNSAVQIDWYTDPHNLRRSRLLALVNRRAALSAGRPIDIFKEYLPPSLRADGSGDIRSQLLEHTRYVPRDMIMLLRYLQEYSGTTPMTRHQVMSALTAYSRDYLVPEIRDELDGYVDGDRIELMIRLLGSLRKISPSFRELRDEATRLGVPSDVDLGAILRVLFECSAIGNLAMSSSRFSSAIFKYQHPHASYKRSEAILVHRGLWIGLGLRW